MKDYLPLILGMMAVTYLPRLIPMVTLTQRPLPPVVRRFLVSIPYAALSVLIVRGIIQASPEMMLPTVAGITVAGIAAWFKGGLTLSVLAGITASFLVIHASGG